MIIELKRYILGILGSCLKPNRKRCIHCIHWGIDIFIWRRFFIPEAFWHPSLIQDYIKNGNTSCKHRTVAVMVPASSYPVSCQSYKHQRWSGHRTRTSLPRVLNVRPRGPFPVATPTSGAKIRPGTHGRLSRLTFGTLLSTILVDTSSIMLWCQ